MYRFASNLSREFKLRFGNDYATRFETLKQIKSFAAWQQFGTHDTNINPQNLLQSRLWIIADREIKQIENYKNEMDRKTEK